MGAPSVLVLSFHGSAMILLALLVLSLLCWLKVLKPVHRHMPASVAEERRLPPSLPATAVLSLILQRCFQPDLKSLLRRVFTKHGPIATLWAAGTGNPPTILVFDATLACRILVGNGVSFAGRPASLEPMPLITAVSAADYGPVWCALRRNLASGILNPAVVRSYAASRRRVLGSLLRRLSTPTSVVAVRDHFLRAMFSLLADMVFGTASTLDEDQVKSLQDAHQALLSYYNELAFGFLNPKVVWSWVLPTSMSILPKLRRSHEQIFLPLIRARREKMEMMRQRRLHPLDQNPPSTSYVETLIALELPDATINGGFRKLDDHEIVTFCTEFLSAGAETTSTALEWIMANITKREDIQKKLAEETESVIREHGEIKEEDIQKMEYLSAVVTEGLRRHPPAHFLLPHAAVSSEASAGGYAISKGSTVHFMVGDMGLDEKHWSDPLEFKPERFLDGPQGCHKQLTGVVPAPGKEEEVKMMPFGAGRRTCPGLGLAMLVLKYFVANLVTEYEWKAVGDQEGGVDLSEKLGLTVAMKNPLRARLCKRMTYMEKKDSKTVL